MRKKVRKLKRKITRIENKRSKDVLNISCNKDGVKRNKHVGTSCIEVNTYCRVRKRKFIISTEEASTFYTHTSLRTDT